MQAAAATTEISYNAKLPEREIVTIELIETK